MNLAVIGSGCVGLVAGACLAELGHLVTLVDNDDAKLAALTAGEVPIHEQFLPELMARNISAGRLSFSGSIADAVQNSSVIFIAVGTPAMGNGAPDLSYVEAVASAVAVHVGDYKIIVEKSTVPVLTHQQIRKVMMLNGAPLDSVDVVSNPEFLKEGTAVLDFLYPDRIVVGSDSPRAAAALREVYEPLTGGSYYRRTDAIPGPSGFPGSAKLLITSAKGAELIKHASNSFLAMKISFINAVASICEVVGADIEEVRCGIGTDSRIGERFLRPGVGYGGSCFPKDLLAFRLVAHDCGLELGLLDEVIKVNEGQKSRFVSKVRTALWTLRGKRIAALGLAFKGGTDDIRESPAIEIIETLHQEGAEMVVYDPAAMERAKTVLGSSVRYASSAYDACHGAHALLVLTDWQEFAQLDLAQIRNALRHPIVIDGRNIFPCEDMRAAGFHYYSVGRPTVGPGEGQPELRAPSGYRSPPPTFPPQGDALALRKASRSDGAMGTNLESI
jgi:UDPglucose 6-dehydrogenase